MLKDADELRKQRKAKETRKKYDEAAKASTAL
jgi:hypothetical protein